MHWTGGLIVSFEYSLLNYLFEMKIFPVDTGRELNVYRTFRRRSGRLLNIFICSTYVLCLLDYNSQL